MFSRRNNGQSNRLAKWIVIIGVAAIVGGVAAMSILRIVWRARVDEALVEWKEAGYPVEASDLNAWYPEAEWGGNAAEMLQVAMTRYAPAPGESLDAFRLLKDGADAQPIDEPFPKEALAAYQTHVLRNLEALQMVFEALEMPTSRWPVDMTQGPFADLGHIGNYKCLRETFPAMGALGIAKRDPQSTQRAIVSLIKLGDTLRSEPYFVSQLSRDACLYSSVRILERALYHGVLGEEQLAAIHDCLQTASNHTPESYHRAMAAEACASQCFLRDSAEGRWLSMNGASARAQALALVHDIAGLRDREVVYNLEHTRPFLDATALPPEQLASKLPGLARSARQDLPWYCLYSPWLFNNWYSMAKAEIRETLRVRNALTAITIERCRLRTGRLPDSLNDLPDDLKPGICADVYTGQPLGYRKAGDGYTVFSIGPEGEYDGHEIADDDPVAFDDLGLHIRHASASRKQEVGEGAC